MWAFPGKKLLFMGDEIAQWAEWNNDASLDWNLLDVPAHKGVQTLMADLNRLYSGEPAFTPTDADPAGFRWPSLTTGRTRSSPSSGKPPTRVRSSSS